MCGIAGFFDRRGFRRDSAESLARAMADCLVHRGPDDGGVWVDESAGIALGHRRLAILDLSPAGRQPMASASARYVLAFNGEIYNHLEIREEIDAAGSVAWRGHSDTESILAAFERWGIAATLEKCVGMFAFALWDRRDRVLTLARDRMGEKPLYYGWQGATLLFGSELKSLRAHPAFAANIDRDALALYLRYAYVAAPYSIYEAIRKLSPGTFLQFAASADPGALPEPQAYWSLRNVVATGLTDPFPGSDDDAVGELEARLIRAVSRQCIADVPLGAFLSGGVDSSTIVALMQAQATRPVKTFTIGFHEEEYNEAHAAKSVAQHLGTEHTELYVTPREAMDVVPRLASLYDEPFGDSSAIPTFLVAQLARQHVTVALSGDGGDELFAGYRRYRRTQATWDIVRRVPGLGRRLLAGAMAALPPEGLDRLFFVLQGSRGSGPQGERARQMALYLSAKREEDFYRVQLMQWKNPAAILINGAEPPTVLTDPSQWLAEGRLYDRMMYVDSMSYLPDDILVKVDRAAMGVSLETRVPLLDHRVVEFAWRLPRAMKVRDGQGKWLLRQVLYKHVPKALIDRPKKGFGVPVDFWLRGPMRPWAENLLSPEQLAADGFFNAAIIRKRWQQHVDGKKNWGKLLWLVLSFQAWLAGRKNC